MFEHNYEKLLSNALGKKETPKQIVKRIHGQLESLQIGFDPFEEDPSLFHEKDPVVFAEKVIIDPETRTPIRLWDNQKEDMRCKEVRIVHLDGREVGKTVDIVGLFFHLGMTDRNTEYLLATPESQHLSTILLEIEKQTDATPAWNKYFKIKTTKEGHIYFDFTSGVRIHCRSGQSGNSFRGLHVKGVLVDEGQLMKHTGWRALLRCIKKSNGFVRVYGTPNGRRDTYYYSITTKGQWFVFHVASWEVPTWTPEKERQVEIDCGGRDTQMWLNEVAGEHGHPTMPAFDFDALQACIVDIENYRIFNLSGKEFEDLIASSEEAEEKIADRLDDLIDLEARQGVFALGGDLGFSTDPAELKIFEQDHSGVWHDFARIHLEKVPYPIICDVIAWLDNLLNFVFLGIDRGNNGISVMQNLTTLDKYRMHKFMERLFAFDFGSTLLVGYDIDKAGEEDFSKPIKKYAKELATDLINEYLRKRSWMLAASDSLQESQMVSQNCRVSDRRIVYSKGDDHVNDGNRCFFLALWKWELAPEIEAEVQTVEVFVSKGRGL